MKENQIENEIDNLEIESLLTLTNRQLQNRLLMARSCDDHVLPLRRRDIRIARRACLCPNPIQYNTREKRKDVQK